LIDTLTDDLSPSEENLLAQVSGIQCAVEMISSPLGRSAVLGPGAGPTIAGLGIFADLLTIASRVARAGRKSGQTGNDTKGNAFE
jgi:homoserine dehydrogenase